MAGSNLKKFANPGFLRTLAFANLIELLNKFDGYFSGVVHFEYKDVEETKFNFDQLSMILADQMMVGEYTELFDAIGLIGIMSSDSHEEILREFIDAQPYKWLVSDNMTAADLALLVYLHDPDSLNNLETQFSATRKKSFAMRATKIDMTEMEISSSQLEVFEEQLNNVFVSKHRGKTAKVYPPISEGDERWIIIRHGDSFKRQGTVESGKKSKTLAFQPESFDLLVLNVKTGELRICVPAEPQWLENCYAQALGWALFGDYCAFDDRRNNDLERIKDLGERVLISPQNLGITRLDLIGISYFHSSTCLMPHQLSASAGNLFRDLNTANIDLSKAGEIYEAKFAVKIGKREKTVILKNNNRSGYEYDEFGAAVDAWLRSVGIIHSQKIGSVAA